MLVTANKRAHRVMGRTPESVKQDICGEEQNFSEEDLSNFWLIEWIPLVPLHPLTETLPKHLPNP